MLEDFEITVKTTITRERIEDLLCMAFEGAISYWARIVDCSRVASSAVPYSHQIPCRGGMVQLGDSTTEGWPSVHRDILSRDTLKRGMQVMADKYPKHFSDFLKGNEDDITADVFVQCCVFGRIVFG